jgi:drug/metabolite transporter (DMT)-like permease
LEIREVKVKITKKFTHYWFVIVSVLSFLAGWGMLAHSLKPVTASQTTTVQAVALPTLAPIQVFGTGDVTTRGTSNGLNLIVPPNNQSSAGFPLLRTGGS